MRGRLSFDPRNEEYPEVRHLEQRVTTMDLIAAERMDAHREAASLVGEEFPMSMVKFVTYIGPLANGKHRWRVTYRT